MFEELHLLVLAMHEHDVPRLAVPDQLHDALGVGVGAEGHVLGRTRWQGRIVITAVLVTL